MLNETPIERGATNPACQAAGTCLNGVISGTATAKFKAKPVTFAELAKAALEYSKAHKSDHRHDDSRMKLVLETFRNRPADAITPQELERWLADEADENDFSPAMVNRYKALFSLTFRIGVENGHIKYNPARLVKRRREHNTRVRWLLPQEEKRLRSVMDAAGKGSLASPPAREMFRQSTGSKIAFVMPGSPKVRLGSRGFAAYGSLAVCAVACQNDPDQLTEAMGNRTDGFVVS